MTQNKKISHETASIIKGLLQDKNTVFNITHICKKIRVNENWHPSHNDKDGLYIRVSIIKDSPIIYRIALWGDDDFGLEKEVSKLSSALKEYNAIVDFVTQKELMNNGYVQA